MAFNPAEETARYIDSLGPEALQKAADYTSASHRMLLWGFFVSAVVTWIIVRTGILDRVAVRLEKRGWSLRIWLVGLTYFLTSAIIGLPWGIYQEWGFEKSYGRTSQPLSGLAPSGPNRLPAKTPVVDLQKLLYTKDGPLSGGSQSQHSPSGLMNFASGWSSEGATAPRSGPLTSASTCDHITNQPRRPSSDQISPSSLLLPASGKLPPVKSFSFKK